VREIERVALVHDSFEHRLDEDLHQVALASTRSGMVAALP
jgi:hypothetical protein